MIYLSKGELEVEGNFPLHKAIIKALPQGTKVVSAEQYGISTWAKTAKLSAILPDGYPKAFFLKCATGQTARALTEGEYHSASAINSLVTGLVPNPTAWGEYTNDDTQVYFFISDFHDMDFSISPDPVKFMKQIAELHQKGASPNGMFGYPVPTVIGKMQRTVTWEKSWAISFTHQLKDVIEYDNNTNGPWPKYDAACKQLIDHVIPRLLGVLQSDGREIIPTLVHGDLWERNVGIDRVTGKAVLFDPGCTYAHNEMEFGTWRCTWAFYFNSPVFMSIYQGIVKPSEPADEWDDRNRLYSLHAYLTDSAGHKGSISRQIAYNDMLYLCEKYAPLYTLEKYDPKKDVSVTGAHIPFTVAQFEETK
ncbi:Fructosamine kinase-domain-containing protein [Camillea tinctor]|nr:Fructosamine kinase-domain-containing protein [Camillea tinctor]